MKQHVFRTTLYVIYITILLAMLLISIVWTHHLHNHPTIGIDDANIFFSYADNLASGRGITYANNHERVEGFTSMLWMLLSASVFKVGLSHGGIFALSTTLFVSTHVVILYAINRMTLKYNSKQKYIYSGIYIALIISSPSYVTWMTITLMDVSLWGLIIVCLSYYVVFPPEGTRSWMIIHFIALISPLARPESIIVIPALVSIMVLRNGILTERKNRLLIGSVLVCFLLSLSLLITFRINYFGYPLPNTYYAKVSPSLSYNLLTGIKYPLSYIAHSLFTSVAFGLILSQIILFVTRMFGRIHSFQSYLFNLPRSVALSVICLVLLITPALSGGDHFAMYRFLQPVYPLLCLLTVYSLIKSNLLPNLHRYVSGSNNSKSIIHGIGLSVLTMVWLFFFAINSESSWRTFYHTLPILHEFELAENGVRQGEILSDIFGSLSTKPSLGVITAGGIARTYSGEIIDLMGLNNVTIAHFKGDRKGFKNHAAFEIAVFYELKPDILLIPPPPETYIHFLKGLQHDDIFVMSYRYGTFKKESDPGLTINVFISHEFAGQVEKYPDISFQDTHKWVSNQWMRDMDKD